MINLDDYRKDINIHFKLPIFDLGNCSHLYSDTKLREIEMYKALCRCQRELMEETARIRINHTFTEFPKDFLEKMDKLYSLGDPVIDFVTTMKYDPRFTNKAIVSIPIDYKEECKYE